VYSPAGSVPPPSQLTSYTPTKSNFNFDSFLETFIKELTLYKLLYTYYYYYYYYYYLFFYGKGLLGLHQTPELEHHPLSFVRSCLFNTFAATFHSWRPFLHPQPENAPCCGDRDYNIKEHHTRGYKAKTINTVGKL
jgi:hypothetical protein